MAIDTGRDLPVAASAAEDASRAYQWLGDTVDSDFAYAILNSPSCVTRRVNRYIEQGETVSHQKFFVRDALDAVEKLAAARDAVRSAESVLRSPPRTGKLALQRLTSRRVSLSNDQAVTERRLLGNASAEISTALRSYLEPLANRQSAIDHLLEQDPHQLSVAQWKQLTALLDTDFGDELKVLRDIDGATSSLRRFSSLMAQSPKEMYSDVSRYFRANSIAKMSPHEQDELAHSILDRNLGDLTSEDWTTIEALFDARSTSVQVSIPEKRIYPTSMWAYARQMAEEPTSMHLDTLYDYFGVWKVRDATPEQRVEELNAILGKAPAAVSRLDWERFSGYYKLDPEGVATALHLSATETQALATVAATFRKMPYTYNPLTNHVVERWQLLNDPDFRANMNAAFDRVIDGTGTADDIAFAAREIGNKKMLEGRSAADRSLLADAVVKGGGYPHRMATALKEYRDYINLQVASGLSDPMLANVATEAKRLIDLNLQRMAGVTPDGAVKGYLSYPDFSEIGIIRASVAMIRDMSHQPKPPENVS
jgi:hypothetical protein